MLFINHDQRQVGHGSQHRQTRAQHDARRAHVCGQPTVEPLRGRHAAVHGHDEGLAHMGKALPHPCFQLRREVDFRHQQQDLGFGRLF